MNAFHFRPVIPLLALLLVLVAAVPVVAVPPVNESGSWVDDFYLFTCEKQGFAVFDHATGDYDKTSFFDQQNALVRVHGHEYGIDRLHREGDSTKMLASKFSNTYVWDAVTLETKVTGLPFNIHLPDGGLAFKASGQAIFNSADVMIKRVGADYIDQEAVCNYLAP